MKKQRKHLNNLFPIITLVVILLVVIAGGGYYLFKRSQTNLTPVEAHGRLSVKANQIVDKNGKAFQLRGVSTHGINLNSKYHKYINPESLVYMRDQWKINVVRIARYTPNNDANWVKDINWNEEVKREIQYAIDAGLYVIVDWHVLKPGDPNELKDQAITFFTDIATQFKNSHNVIYEICNEPNGADVTWQDTVKPYAEEVINAIRAIDTKAIIAVGSSTWSQDLDKVAVSPLTGNNLVYTLHFYAATHKQKLRDKLQAALDAGLPILVTECGMCAANGDGAIDTAEAAHWLALLNQYKVGFVIWQLSNKAEGASLIKNDVDKLTGWTDDELTEHGKWLVDTLRHA